MSRLGTAIACYCRHAPGEGVEHVFPVPHIPEAVSAVRRRVRHVLDGWELTGEAADTTLLVVSELVTNAIVHALPPATLRLCWTRLDGHRTLRVEVSDGGPAAPARYLSPRRPQWPRRCPSDGRRRASGSRG